MSEDFDPYRKWLGIAPHEQPPHHYRLLGIAPFEDDPDVIENAADRQMAHVRTFQAGRYRDYSQRILNELSAAKIMLLDPARKGAYDAQLHEALFGEAPAQEPELEEPPAMPPVAAPPPRREPVAQPARGIPVGQPVPVTAAAPMVNVRGKSRSVAARGRRKQNSVVPIVLALVGVGAVSIGLLVFLVTQSGDDSNADNKSNETKQVAKETSPAPTPSDANKSSTTNKATPPAERNNPVPPGNLPASAGPKVEVPADQKFKFALVAARDALTRRDLPAAKTALAEAGAMPEAASNNAEIEHVQQLLTHLETFWKAVNTGVKERMQEGDVFEFDGDVVELVGRTDDEVTFIFNTAEQKAKVADLPAPVAALVARKGQNMREPKALLGVATFLALDSKGINRSKAQERAKALWVEAAERGQKDAAVAQELGLDAAFIASIETKAMTDEPLPRITPPEQPAGSTPGNDSPTASAPVEQQPVPTMEQLREGKQLFAEKYGDDLAKARKTPTDYEAFLNRLKEAAPGEKNRSLQYVMYEEACDAAANVLRHDELIQLVDAMAERWEIDPLRTKQLLLLKARPLSSPATENFADTAAALAKEAEAAGRLDVAIAAANYSLRVGDKVKGRDQKELLRRVRDWEALADAAAKAQAGEATLAKDPTDGDAHLQVGRYLCYFKREWPTGLAHLAKSNAEDEQLAAQEDLANPTNADAQFALAERWYQLSKRKSGTARQAVLERAKHWLEMASPALEEALRTTAENRLREIMKDLAPLMTM